MNRVTESPGWLARCTCGVLAAYALLTVATGVAAWHRYQVLLAPPLPPQPDGSEGLPLLVANMWFGNLSGCWSGASTVTLLVLVFWMACMRGVAERVWPEGQRRSRAWLFFGWIVPLANLFVIKMFVNDLWAAAQPAARRVRGHLLLTFWWLFILGAGAAGVGGISALKHAYRAGDASQALQQVILSEVLHICAAALSIAVVWRLSGMLKRATRATVT